MYHSPLRSFCLIAGSTATVAISFCRELGSSPLIQCIAITIRFIISFGLQRCVSSYIRVVHYMSMFCWADQLNYTVQKTTSFPNAHSQKGK